MNRSGRLLRVLVGWLVLSVGAQYALAQLPGPFEFSFATGFLNNIFLLPFRLGGCG